MAGLLGEQIRDADVEGGTLQADYVADERFANPAGGVQGGMLGAMLDVSAGIQNSPLMGTEISPPPDDGGGKCKEVSKGWLSLRPA